MQGFRRVFERWQAPVLVARQVLNKSAPVVHIEQLKAATNGQNRQVPFECSAEQFQFHLVSRRIRPLCFRLRCLPIELGFDIRASSKKDAVDFVYRKPLPGLDRHRFEPHHLQRRLVPLDFP